MVILNRLPKLSQIAAVYAVIVLAIYIWTILWSFWKLPSWLFFLSIGEILTIYAYSFATNLLESLLILCLPLGLGAILPRKWFLDAFVSRGVIVVLSVLGYAAYILTQFNSREDYPGNIIRLFPVVLLASLVLAFFVGKVKFLSRAIDFISEQATVFLFISIPLSLIALLVVLVRVIF